MSAPWLLGSVWGLVVAAPVVARARRHRARARVAVLGVRRAASAADGPDRGAGRVLRSLLARVTALPGARVVPALFARRSSQRVDDQLGRELPVTVDVLAVAVGSGCTPYGAVEVAARWAPPVAARHLVAVRERCALGAALADALTAAAVATPRLRGLVDALLASERLGAPAGPALALVAAEERAGLRRSAETHARRVPVRLLFPLVFCVLPAFVLLTVVPSLAAGLART